MKGEEYSHCILFHIVYVFVVSLVLIIVPYLSKRSETYFM